MLHAGADGVCDTVIMGQQDLYLHPTSFSGVMDESNIQTLMEQLSKAKTFQCYAFDCYEEYADMSDDEYRSVLELKREEIMAFILEQCRTKRVNLYITDPIVLYIAKHFEICRIRDRNRHNAMGNKFMSELVEQLLLEGRHLCRLSLCPACGSADLCFSSVLTSFFSWLFRRFCGIVPFARERSKPCRNLYQ